VATIFAIQAGLTRLGNAVLLVEQNAYLAVAHASRDYELEHGEIALDGTVAELRENPAIPGGVPRGLRYRQALGLRQATVEPLLCIGDIARFMTGAQMEVRNIIGRAALVMIGLLAFAGIPGHAAEEPYDIYAMISLTGPAAFVGRGEQVALGAIERWTNNTGGIKGRPVHFVILDDQSNPSIAVQLANQIISKHVPVLLGPGFAATCNAVLPLLANGPVAYCFSPSIAGPRGSYLFATLPSTRDALAPGLRYLNEKGVRKIALLTSTDTTGQDGEQVALESVTRPEFREMQVVANEHMASGDLTVAAQIARIKATDAKAIDAWMTGPPFGTVLRGLADAGWDGYVLTHTGNMNKTLLDAYAQVIPRQLIILAAPLYSTGQVPAATRLARTTYLDALHQSNVAEPDLSHLIGWDPTMVVIHVLRELGTGATAVQVRDRILGLHNFVGVNGPYDFRRGDQRGIDPSAGVVVRWDKNTREFVTITQPGGRPF
jgi:branched-chain amino acid transport system substrate-binding protein